MHYRELDTPALFVDLDILEKNLASMARYARDHYLSLRPHTKTHKTVELARMQVESGATGLTVAKVGEAEVLAAAGFDDLLIAFPVYGEKKKDRIARLCETRNIMVSLDSEVTARHLAEAMTHRAVKLGVLVEVDMGVGRCGVSPGPQAVALAKIIDRLDGLTFHGVMGFFGNVWGNFEQREKTIELVSRGFEQAFESFFDEKIPLEIVSGGSTSSAPLTHLVPGLTEIRPGTYVFNDLNTFHQEACRLEDCAARVLATVVSTAVHGQVILDVGSKTLSSEPLGAGPCSGFGLVLEVPEGKLYKLNEEHGFLGLPSPQPSLRIGDTVTVIPNHICPCVNLHDEISLVRNDEVVGRWQVAARGKVR